jgi:hypothetical protein
MCLESFSFLSYWAKRFFNLCHCSCVELPLSHKNYFCYITNFFFYLSNLSYSLSLKRDLLHLHDPVRTALFGKSNRKIVNVNYSHLFLYCTGTFFRLKFFRRISKWSEKISLQNFSNSCLKSYKNYFKCSFKWLSKSAGRPRLASFFLSHVRRKEKKITNLAACLHFFDKRKRDISGSYLLWTHNLSHWSER